MLMYAYVFFYLFHFTLHFCSESVGRYRFYRVGDENFVIAFTCKFDLLFAKIWAHICVSTLINKYLPYIFYMQESTSLCKWQLCVKGVFGW